MRECVPQRRKSGRNESAGCAVGKTVAPQQKKLCNVAWAANLDRATQRLIFVYVCEGTYAYLYIYMYNICVCALYIRELLELFRDFELLSDLFWLQEKFFVEVVNENLNVVCDFLQLGLF